MKTKTLLNIKVIALITILLCAFFITFSCDNLFSGVSTDDTPTGGAGISTSDSNRTIIITGTISNPYDGTRTQSRSAKPSYDYPDTDKQYVVWAEATEGSNTITTNGNGSTSDNTFSIPLELGKIWTIKVELQKKRTRRHRLRKSNGRLVYVYRSTLGSSFWNPHRNQTDH